MVKLLGVIVLFKEHYWLKAIIFTIQYYTYSTEQSDSSQFSFIKITKISRVKLIITIRRTKE